MAKQMMIPGSVQVQIHAVGEEISVDLTTLTPLGLDVLIERGLSVMFSNSFISAVRKACEELAPAQPNNGASYALCTPEQKKRAWEIFLKDIVPSLNDKINAGTFQPGQKSNPRGVAAGLFKQAYGNEPDAEQLEKYMQSDGFKRGQERVAADRLAKAQAAHALKRGTDQTVLEMLIDELLESDPSMPEIEAIAKVFGSCKSVKNLEELRPAINAVYKV